MLTSRPVVIGTYMAKFSRSIRISPGSLPKPMRASHGQTIPTATITRPTMIKVRDILSARYVSSNSLVDQMMKTDRNFNTTGRKCACARHLCQATSPDAVSYANCVEAFCLIARAAFSESCCDRPTSPAAMPRGRPAGPAWGSLRRQGRSSTPSGKNQPAHQSPRPGSPR
jgi:hypothetical protein